MLRSPASWIASLLLVPSAVLAQVPAFQWAVQPMLPTGDATAYGLAMDANGNVFACGTFADTVTFSTGTIRATGNTVPNNRDAYVVKHGPNGDVLWARHGGSSSLGSFESGYAVAVDDVGAVYMTGEYGGSQPTTFDGIEIAASGGGAFAVKYDKDGTVQWAKSITTTATGNGIATSGSSLVYVYTGGFPSSVMKLDGANGNVLDTWNFTGFVPDQDMKLSVDGSGNVIISGTFAGTVDFDPGAGVSNLVGDGSGDGFVAKYDGSGALQWVRQLASPGPDLMKSHALAAAGDVYFCGSVDGTATCDTVTADGGQVVGRLNSDGRALWMRNTTSQFLDADLALNADRIGLDGTGDYYITGVGFGNAGTIGTFTIPAENNFHVVRYDASGAVIYAAFATSSDGLLIPRAFTVHISDFYQVAGGKSTAATFDPFNLPDINGNPRPSPFVAQVGDITSPVLASLATAEAAPDRVRLRWYVTGLEGAALVERRRGSDEWLVLGEAARGGPDYLVYEDRDVAPGERLTYRLRWNEGGETLHSDPVEITVPHAIGRIALTAAPNPAGAAFDARIELPGPGQGTLAMHDLLGREVAERQFRADAAGRMVVRLATSELPAGLYWLSLRHGAGSARTRVSIVR